MQLLLSHQHLISEVAPSFGVFEPLTSQTLLSFSTFLFHAFTSKDSTSNNLWIKRLKKAIV